jgi:hypothetical protein
MSVAAKSKYKQWKDGHDDYKAAGKHLPKKVNLADIMSKIDAGMCRSLKRYDGSMHHDFCSLCKKGGKLLLCDWCSQVNHYHCLRDFFLVPRPADHDDFMCHDCLQKAIHELPSNGSHLKKEIPSSLTTTMTPGQPQSTNSLPAITKSSKQMSREHSRFVCPKLEFNLRDKKYGFGTELYNLIEVRSIMSNGLFSLAFFWSSPLVFLFYYKRMLII